MFAFAPLELAMTSPSQISIFFINCTDPNSVELFVVGSTPLILQYVGYGFN